MKTTRKNITLLADYCTDNVLRIVYANLSDYTWASKLHSNFQAYTPDGETVWINAKTCKLIK